MTQERINAFADVTEDHQFIHVDPKLAAELSPWGVTVAHGFLTLSLLVKLSESIPQPPERLDGAVMGVNYGFDKVRFISPVKVGSRIRCSSVLGSVELKDAEHRADDADDDRRDRGRDQAGAGRRLDRPRYL